MTTESQGLSLKSHPKDGAILERLEDPHRPQGERPLLALLTPLPTAA